MGTIACIGVIVLIAVLIVVVSRPRTHEEAEYMQDRDRRGLLIVVMAVVFFAALYYFTQ
jgi:hypothetical protein